MEILTLSVCFVIEIYAFGNKIYSEKKYGALKKSGKAVYLPESFFWIGFVSSCSLFITCFVIGKLRIKAWWEALIFLLAFLFMSSVQFAQANSRIYYDKEHIYYSTWLGHKITFDYTDIIGKKNGLDTILITNKKRNIRVETTGIGRKKFLRFVQLRLKELKKDEIQLDGVKPKKTKR